MRRPIMTVGMNPQGVVDRRLFLKQLGAGVAGGGAVLGWRELLTAKADELRKRGKSMILLWMDGGPSQFETFNPKIGSKNQGPAKAIATKLPGVQFGEDWPKTAQVMDKIALIRSMKSSERDHSRAIKLVRSGYPPSPAVQFPTFGSVVAWNRSEEEFDLPAFVRVGKPRIATRDISSGALGSKFAAFRMDDPEQLPPDVKPRVSADVLQRRLALANQFDAEFAASGAQAAVREKKEIYDRTRNFVLSPRLGVFDLTQEPDKLRDSYGRNVFGQGCLLARRLVESGVSFIEVFSAGSINDQGWDTHKRGFKENPILASETDSGYATLLTDLHDRGMLDDTLVVWMGEFGRTPKFKKDGGRDHYSDGWLAAFSGGGVQMGQVIGATDKDGVKVSERPVGVQDLYVSICHSLGLDPHDEYLSRDNRPIKVVEGGKLVKELFS
ncbi:MAG: DUF1501 domain-containing protein [Planctomycetales bacterium]